MGVHLELHLKNERKTKFRQLRVKKIKTTRNGEAVPWLQQEEGSVADGVAGIILATLATKGVSGNREAKMWGDLWDSETSH